MSQTRKMLVRVVDSFHVIGRLYSVRAHHLALWGAQPSSTLAQGSEVRAEHRCLPCPES
jgi:hypothetical protein